MRSELDREGMVKTMTARSKPILMIFTATVLILIAGINIMLAPLGILEYKQLGRYKDSVRVPILMYHHFGDEGASSLVISAEMFESQMKALVDAGYTSVSFSDVRDYVNTGAQLPEKPILITIDDGYTSVYETAYPIFLKYNIKATVFIVGIFHGKTMYKDSPYLLVPPHFGDDEAREMSESGLISIQSHSYDMHHIEQLEQEYRKGVLRMPGEPRGVYDEAFKADFDHSSAQIENATGCVPFVYSYPYGRYTNRSEALLKIMGVEATVIIVPGISTIVRGAPESLYKLKRLTVNGDMTPDQLLEMIRTGISQNRYVL